MGQYLEGNVGSGGGFFAKMKEITACFYIYEND